MLDLPELEAAEGRHTETLDIAELPAGTYMLKVQAEGSRANSRKWIKRARQQEKRWGQLRQPGLELGRHFYSWVIVREKFGSFLHCRKFQFSPCLPVLRRAKSIPHRVMQHTWTDEQFIASIRAGGDVCNRALEAMIKAWYGYAVKFIVRKGGTEQEARAALSCALMGVVKTVQKPDFQLHSAKSQTYFTTALLRCWLNRNGKGKSLSPVEFDGQKHISGHEPSPEDELIQSERIQKVRNALRYLGEPCKTILTMFSEGYSWKEIAELLDLPLQGAKKKGQDCKGKLRRLLTGQIEV